MKILAIIPLLLIILAFSACVTDSTTYITGEPRSRTLGGGQTRLGTANESPSDETAYPMPVSVLFPTQNMVRAMYEPSEGIHLAAWLPPAMELRSFVAQSGHNHAAFVYELPLCQPVPTSWVLQCMSVMAAPIFVVYPPHQPCEETPIGETIAALAQAMGEFNMPMFVAFYPTTGYYGHGLAPAEYSIIFRYARAIFMHYAPQVTFVWVAPSVNATIRNPFFPGHDAVDWIGVELLASRGSYGFTHCAIETFAPFYHMFAPHHPIMLLPLGVSHFSRHNHAYEVEEAEAEILRLYQALASFPRVGLVAYADAFGVARTGKDDFAITVEKRLVAAYNKAAYNPHFLPVLQTAESHTPRLARSPHLGYFWQGNMYISIATLAELNISAPRQTVEFGGSLFVCSSRISGRNVWFCEVRQVIMLDV